MTTRAWIAGPRRSPRAVRAARCGPRYEHGARVPRRCARSAGSRRELVAPGGPGTRVLVAHAFRRWRSRPRVLARRPVPVRVAAASPRPDADGPALGWPRRGAGGSALPAPVVALPADGDRAVRSVRQGWVTVRPPRSTHTVGPRARPATRRSSAGSGADGTARRRPLGRRQGSRAGRGADPRWRADGDRDPVGREALPALPAVRGARAQRRRPRAGAGDLGDVREEPASQTVDFVGATVLSLACTPLVGDALPVPCGADAGAQGWRVVHPAGLGDVQVMAQLDLTLG